MKIDNIMINKELLDELFVYCDGKLYYKNHKYKKLIGKKVGTLNSNGYLYAQINGKRFANHRLIFLMHHNYLPQCIDHINGNKLDNSIENLREATYSQNGQNAKLRKDNTSGIKNISWNKTVKKWRVQIKIDGKRKHIGLFDNLELAELVAIEIRNKYCGEFANHGN